MWLGGWVAATLFAMVGIAYFVGPQLTRNAFHTPYQAVLLSNGAVYYGKLDGYGSTHPVLTEVYYIVSQTNPENKQQSNVLVKRGKELHGPDRMYLNPQHILFVEPVGEVSKVSELIGQARQ